MVNNEDNYTDISAYGLLHLLRETVGARRKSKIPPTRSTVYSAFHGDESELTPLQKLIVKTGREILSVHEKEIETLQPA